MQYKNTENSWQTCNKELWQKKTVKFWKLQNELQKIYQISAVLIKIQVFLSGILPTTLGKCRYPISIKAGIVE